MHVIYFMLKMMIGRGTLISSGIYVATMYSRKYAEWMWLQINHLDTIHFIRIKVITVEQTISINILNKKII